MSRPSARAPFSLLALVAVLLTVAGPVVAACPGMIDCPMAAEMALTPPPVSCHGASGMPAHEPPRRMAADDCCAGAPPALPPAVPEARASLSPEAPAAAPAATTVHPAGVLAAFRAPEPGESGPPLAAPERLSLLQTFLI